MALLLAGIPAVIVWAVILPSVRRSAGLRRRIDAAHQVARDVRPFIPVGGEERAFLEGPGAPWRSRLPWVPDDAARLAHVDRVVNEVGAAFGAKGVRIAGMKVVMDPVRADFSLPPRAGREAFPLQAVMDSPENRVDGWVLDVEIAGSTGDLFKALSAVTAVNALLEPVGLTWEAAPAKDGDPAGAGHSQHLLLRTLHLKPGS